MNGPVYERVEVSGEKLAAVYGQERLRTHLYSVWNVTKRDWATSTNYSTPEEAQALMGTITRVLKSDQYIVKSKKMGRPRPAPKGV